MKIVMEKLACPQTCVIKKEGDQDASCITELVSYTTTNLSILVLLAVVIEQALGA